MKKIIIFGTGKFFATREKKLKMQYEIVGFLDNKIGVGETVYYKDTSIPIYNPADIKVPQNYPIFIMTRRFIEVCVQLLQMGIAEERIVFGISSFPESAVEQIAFCDGEGLKIEEGEIILKIKGKQSYKIVNEKDYEKVVMECARIKRKLKDPMIEMISHMPLVPTSRSFGCERGKAIDRYYIENFLDERKEFIKGDTLEIAETTYSVKYGKERIRNAYMLHVKGWGENVIKGNLETGEGIEENRFDTAIITQTLMFLYDIQSAAQNIYKMLRPGGTALVTVAGISQVSRYDADNWGSYYSFHADAVKRLFESYFREDNIEIVTYGNVKTAISLLYGLCCEDLEESDFQVCDPDYPLIIGVMLKK